MELTIDLHGLTHKKALLKVEEHLLTSELYKLANIKVITGNSPELQNKIIKEILVPYKFDYYIEPHNAGVMHITDAELI
jgi:DNA-nicking Smr family endonuclease|tara:strand:+ start:376 stop:612 length:237 start_codon:yes stop_codon:yes gene_type:complete